MHIDIKWAGKIEFHHTQCIIAAGRLSDPIRKIIFGIQRPFYLVLGNDISPIVKDLHVHDGYHGRSFLKYGQKFFHGNGMGNIPIWKQNDFITIVAKRGVRVDGFPYNLHLQLNGVIYIITQRSRWNVYNDEFVQFKMVNPAKLID